MTVYTLNFFTVTGICVLLEYEFWFIQDLYFI